MTTIKEANNVWSITVAKTEGFRDLSETWPDPRQKTCSHVHQGDPITYSMHGNMKAFSKHDRKYLIILNYTKCQSVDSRQRSQDTNPRTRLNRKQRSLLIALAWITHPIWTCVCVISRDIPHLWDKPQHQWTTVILGHKQFWKVKPIRQCHIQ